MTERAGVTTPVAFFVFNRPDTTRRVLQRIREARPAMLLVVSDGPRSHVPTDGANVAAVRDLVRDLVDWPCELVKNYSEENLGCRVRVSSGLDWVFKQTEEAIILEDDTLPDLSFFPFAEAMLARYRDAKEVVHITGNNLLAEHARTDGDYFFSKYPFIWGWATWRRAWQNYRVDAGGHEAFVKSREFRRICPTAVERGFWRYNFRSSGSGAFNTWDYQWNYACWRNAGLSVVPRVNLVENIGFGPSGTHITEADWRAERKAESLLPPYSAPSAVVADAHYDHWVFERVFEAPKLRQYRTFSFRAKVVLNRVARALKLQKKS